MKDPLDEPSGVFDMGDASQRVLTFRELQERCAMDMKYWDSIGRNNRLASQKLNDPYYRPIVAKKGVE